MLVRTLPGMISDATFYGATCQYEKNGVVWAGFSYEISKMDVAVRIEENIVRFHITMYDALTVYVS